MIRSSTLSPPPNSVKSVLLFWTSLAFGLVFGWVECPHFSQSRFIIFFVWPGGSTPRPLFLFHLTNKNLKTSIKVANYQIYFWTKEEDNFWSFSRKAVTPSLSVAQKLHRSRPYSDYVDLGLRLLTALIILVILSTFLQFKLKCLSVWVSETQILGRTTNICSCS